MIEIILISIICSASFVFYYIIKGVAKNDNKIIGESTFYAGMLFGEIAILITAAIGGKL